MKKVLIAYSTWAGATHEVANEIGKVFQANLFDVDVIAANESKSVDTYDVILFGTSIHAGQTVKSFRQFIKQNIDILIKKPTALFVVCANMMNDSEEASVSSATGKSPRKGSRSRNEISNLPCCLKK